MEWVRCAQCQGLSFAVLLEEHTAVVGRAGKKQCSCCSPSLSLFKKKKSGRKEKNLFLLARNFNVTLNWGRAVVQFGEKRERWWRLLPSLAWAVVPRGFTGARFLECAAWGARSGCWCPWAAIQQACHPALLWWDDFKQGLLEKLCGSRNIYGVRTVPSWWCDGEINLWIKCGFCLCLTQFRRRKENS